MKLSDRKSQLKFETGATVQGRPLVVVVHPQFLEIRQKGRREFFTVPWDAVFESGAKMAAREAANQKSKEAKK